MSNVIPFPGSASASTPPNPNAPFVTLLSSELRPPGDIDSPDGGLAFRAGLAKAIDLGTQAAQAFGATDVAIEGGPSRPHLTARFVGPTSALNATRAALALRERLAEVGGPFAPHPLQVGSGIAGGEVTARTTPGGVAFEDAGTTRVLAATLRDFAGSGQIFLSGTVRHLLGEKAQVMELGAVHVDRRGGTAPAYALLALVETQD